MVSTVVYGRIVLQEVAGYEEQTSPGYGRFRRSGNPGYTASESLEYTCTYLSVPLARQSVTCEA